MIRLQRVGRTNESAFRLVLAEKRSKPKSGALEILGSYHPKTKAAILKNERILYWFSKGAKFSSTVHNLLVSKGVIQGKKIDVVKVSSIKTILPSVSVVPEGKTAETLPAKGLKAEEKSIEVVENKERTVATKEEIVV